MLRRSHVFRNFCLAGKESFNRRRNTTQWSESPTNYQLPSKRQIIIWIIKGHLETVTVSHSNFLSMHSNNFQWKGA